MDRPRTHTSNTAIGSVLTLFAAGCSGTEGPTYRGYNGCKASYMALCAEGRGPMPFRDGDPVLDACAVLGYSPDQMWGPPMFRVGPPGVTRTAPTYDLDGRVISVESDCGLEEPHRDSFEWNGEGRLARYYGDWNEEGDSMEKTPIYEAGRLIAHESVVYRDGVGQTTPGRVDYVLDSEGRLVGRDEEDSSGGTSHYVLAYESDRLASMMVEQMDPQGNLYSSTVSYAYDADGRLTETISNAGTSDEYVRDINWTSDTTARFVLGSDPIDVEIEVDGAGRLVRTTSPGGELTWEWGEDGRLVEFWMRNE